jgi:hypothetical protein
VPSRGGSITASDGIDRPFPYYWDIRIAVQRILIVLLLLSFQCCYLRWAGGHAAFIFQMEYELLFSNKVSASSFLHPAILLPLSGQVLLLISLFQHPPRRWFVIAGIALTVLLVLLILLAGLLSKDMVMILCCLPFIVLSIVYMWLFSRKRA